MVLKLLDKTKETFNNVTKRIDRRILVYLVFVAISSVFWLLNDLSGNFTTSFNYPVRFTNLPQNKVLVNELPTNLNLHVNAQGYTLLRYKYSPASVPIIINMEEFGNNFGKPSIKQFKLQTRFIRETISRQMPAEIEVLDISPDTILFQFATIVSKKVAIKPNVKLNFEGQCMLNGEISFTPDSLLVKGPNSIIDTLSGIYTKIKEFKGLNKPIETSIALIEVRKLEFDTKKVLMQLPVSKFTQANFEVPILSKNLPDSLDIKTFPRMAQIECLLPFNEYGRVQANDFILIIDYNEIATLLGNKLSIKLELAPNSAKNISYIPQSVEFILDKKP